MAVTLDDLDYAMHIVRIKKRYENAYVPLIRRAIDQQMQPVIDALRTYGINVAQISIGIISPQPINKVIKGLYLNTTPKEALRE